ncbi:MAG: regulatory signaling modulator protein AmpE [Gammaproteobacteria bacterium]|nr:regulatory signaling modulator protein AmpE [Gammaproteobacteria bacterium]
MALICILFGIIFERVSDILENYRNFDWFDNYSRWILKTLPGLVSQQKSSILILLLPIMLTTMLLQIWFAGRLLGLIDLLFGLVIFAFCLGPKDLNRQVNRYLEAKENGNEDAANAEAGAIMQKEPPTDPDQQVVEVMRSILHESNDRFFAVIFWFVLLGPFGALLYRLTSHTMRSTRSATLANAARQFQAVLAWMPAHLVAMGYALTGNYEGAKQEFYGKNKQEDLYDCNYHTLITAGQGALKDCEPGEETACIRSARALVLRTLVVWLAFIAILTLIGWMS